MASSDVSFELRLGPPEIAIARPTLAEVEALLSALPGPPLRPRGEMELASDGVEGEETRVLLEGTLEGIEAIRVTVPTGEAASPDPRRPWAELAQALDWRLYDTRTGRWLRPQEVLTPTAGWLQALIVARPALMALAACVVLLAVVLWNLGGRRQDAWLVVFGVGVAVYFSLRVWGLLTRGGSRRRPRP